MLFFQLKKTFIRILNNLKWFFLLRLWFVFLLTISIEKKLLEGYLTLCFL